MPTTFAWCQPTDVVPSPEDHPLRWQVEGFLGAAHQVPTRLVIRQEGFESIRFKADYETRAFEFPLYYAVRVSLWQSDDAWALELIHLKTYVRNLPADVQAFAISHGYNLVTTCRLWARREWIYGVSAGLVVAHPENTVRSRALSERRGFLGSGYHLGGPSVGVLTGRGVRIGDLWVLVIEAKATASFARVPVEGGSADVPSLAFHALAGLGYGGREPRE